MAKRKHISLIYHNKIEKTVILDYSTVKTILSNFISNAINTLMMVLLQLKLKKKIICLF